MQRMARILAAAAFGLIATIDAGAWAETEAVEAPAASSAEEAESADARARAALNRDSVFGQKVQFAQAPFPPPATPIVSPDGEVTTLAAHEGKVVVAVFWATWCHVCATEMPEIDKFVASLDDDRILVLPVSLDTGPQAVPKIQAFFERRGVESLPIWIDQDQTNAQLIGLRGTPTSFVINAQGQLTAVVEGRGFWGSDAARGFLEVLAEDARAG